VPIVLKSGIFNLLEPRGPVQACNGIALPLLQLGFQPVAVVGKFVQKQERDSTTQNNKKTRNTQNRKQASKTRKQT